MRFSPNLGYVGNRVGVLLRILGIGAVFCLWVLAVHARPSAEGHPKRKLLTYQDVKHLSKVARDHFIVQFGYMNWANLPSNTAVAPKAFHRGVTLALMYDFLIKGFPYLSVGLGVGLRWENIYLERADPSIVRSAQQRRVQISPVASGAEYFDKSKIGTIYGMAPLELRFSSDPLHYNRGTKIAVGLRLGYLLRATAKGVDRRNAEGQPVNDAKILQRDRSFFEDFQTTGTLRVGWGNVHVFLERSFTAVFKQTLGPQVEQWAVGIGLNGL